MGTDKRERKKANRAAKLEAEHAAELRQRRTQTIRNVVIAGVVIVAVMLLWSLLTGCSSSSGSSKVNSSGDAKTSTTAAATTTPGGGSAHAAYGTGACPPAGGVAKPVIDFKAAPKQCIDPSKTYTATVKTSEGTVVLKLDTTKTPVTANNFITLARYGFYDGTVLFRTEAQSGIIQGGSPHTQDNSDPGPGYTIPDEAIPFTSADYAPGTIAMANTGQPNSGGAQFFFLANKGGSYLGDQAQLGPSAGTYAVFGKVTSGLDVLVKIANLDNGSSAPSKKVTIDKVTIAES